MFIGGATTGGFIQPYTGLRGAAAPSSASASSAVPQSADGPQGGNGGNTSAGDGQRTGELTPEQQAVVQKLKARDSEVRAHEAAHLAAAGPYATSGMSFSYQKGPDGVMYAVGGEVSIDVSPVAGNPEASLQKAQTIQQAALAPADPSGQDRSVAAQAAQMAAKARVELATAQNGTGAAGEVGNEAGRGGRGSGVASASADSGAGTSQPAANPGLRAYQNQQRPNAPLDGLLGGALNLFA